MAKPYTWARSMAKSSSGPNVVVDSVYKKCLPELSTHGHLCTEDCSLQRLFLQRLAKPASWFSQTPQALSPCLLFAVTPPLYSSLYHEHAEIPGCCSFLDKEPKHPIPAFCLCVCLFLHTFGVLVRSIPGSCAGHGRSLRIRNLNMNTNLSI